jgi:hypothetical protein
MFRFGALFVLAFGLALGLYIGFNPQLHRGAQRDFNNAQHTFMHARIQFQSWLDHLTSAQHGPAKSTKVAVPTISWKRFTAGLSAFWARLQLSLSRLAVQVHLQQ